MTRWQVPSSSPLRPCDRALARIVDAAALRGWPPTALRHTAATHMVRGAIEVGELRANADLLGHSPEPMMNTCADTLLDSRSAVGRAASRSVAHGHAHHGVRHAG